MAAKRADTRYLRDVAYADPSGLAARAGLYDFQQPYIDIVAEAVASLGALDGRTVGDVGCGSGRYVDALREAGARVVGVDLSVGMLAGVPDPPPLFAADSQSLPIVDASLDVVMMMHMLYHVSDPARALAEAARVLRPGWQAARRGERTTPPRGDERAVAPAPRSDRSQGVARRRRAREAACHCRRSAASHHRAVRGSRRAVAARR